MTNTTTARKSTSKTAEAAERFVKECEAAGFSVSVKTHGTDAVVTVSASFTPGDTAAYVRCDGTGPLLLCQVPTVTYGSTWGTDGASVGGHAGLSGGYYRLSKSGCSKRFATAVSRLV